MKYCKNCGMLLEDTHEICIGCGADVKEPDSYTLYPPDIEDNLAREKKENRKNTGTIAAIVMIFIFLVVLVVLFAILAPEAAKEGKADKAPKETAEEVKEQDTNADEAGEEKAEEPKEKAGLKDPAAGAEETSNAGENDGKEEVNDLLGTYYIHADIADDSGNVIFSALYPEDFGGADYIIDYGRYSNRYPESLQFMAANQEDTVKFTYMSPSQMWYKDSETGRSRSNERDAINYMSYYTYEGVEAYVDAMIRLSYDNAKNFELVESQDLDPAFTEKLAEVSDAQTQRLLKNTGDYAKIGEGTEYVAEAAEYEAKLLKYKMTGGSKTIYLDFYVPLIANNLYYANETTNDRGRVTEWIVLALYSFEAGSEELYDEYAEAFKEFMHNTAVNKKFYYINSEYGKEIDAAVSTGSQPKPLTKEKLADIAKNYKDSSDIGELNKDISDFIALSEADSKTFNGDGVSIVTTSRASKVFYNKDESKVFITPGTDEYPGEKYTELK